MTMQVNELHGSYNRVKRTKAVRYIVVHYTGSGTSCAGSARANCVYFGGGNRGDSANCFIDDGGIWEYAEPGAYYTWHCGDGHGRYGITNSNSVGIEVCSSGADFTAQEQGYLRELVCSLMARFGVDAAHVVRHWDASRKCCPAPYAPNGGDPSGAKWRALHAYITGGSAEQATVTQQPAQQPAQQAQALAVDGSIGPASVRRWQQVMGTKQDGVISGQWAGSKRYHYALHSIQYGSGGSQLVRAVQKAMGISCDGLMGPDTIRHIQQWLGVSVDGSFGPETARALQRRLNEGKF